MTGLPEALDAIADRLAAVDHHDMPCAAATVVRDLERLAGSTPGPFDDDPVVLARRFARAHRALLSNPPVEDVTAHVLEQLGLLQDPKKAVLRAWDHWQQLRRADAPLAARSAAVARLELARRAVCR